MDWRLVLLLLTPLFYSDNSLYLHIFDHSYNLVLLTLYSTCGCLRGLEGSSMPWYIPLYAEYTLLSGWELGWPFRALLTQPFMSHSDGQTTMMTLPSSSSSSSSHCTHIVFPSQELSLDFFVQVQCAYACALTCTVLPNWSWVVFKDGVAVCNPHTASCKAALDVMKMGLSYNWSDHKINKQCGMMSQDLSNWSCGHETCISQGKVAEKREPVYIK